MIKKLLTSFTLLVFVLPLFSQTIVSTTPENKNVILEEFTGVNCSFCPQGHAIANSIKNANPDDVFLINIHAGGFATPGPGQPDFRTEEGASIDAQAGVTGYPAGTVNRNVFPGLSQSAGGTAMGRGNWANASGQILGQSSYVNVAVEADINTDTNIITVHVEAYYTGNSPVATNKLNVALLQNNTLGPQAGGNMGNSYVHMHRLVKMLTGTWGIDVTNTTQGSFVEETFTYFIPEDFNGIPADILNGDFEVVAFIAEGQQNIISGHGAVATFTSGLENNDVRINSVESPGVLCFGSLAPKVEIYNIGVNEVTSLTFTYSTNGDTPQNYTWTGSLPSLGIQEIELEEFDFNILDENEITISIPNDDDNLNNSGFTTFSYSSDIFETNTVELSITLDNYPQETSWVIRKSDGEVLHSGGPYPGQVGQTISETLSLNDDDCYTFEIFDSFGDGICCGFGQGSYSLTSSSDVVIIEGGNFGESESKTYSNYTPLSSTQFQLNSFVMYPNPTIGYVTINTISNFEFQVFDIQGRNVVSGASNSTSKDVDVSNLNSGVYLVKITVDGLSKTQKLIIK